MKTEKKTIEEIFINLNISSFDPKQGVWIIVPENMAILKEKVNSVIDLALKERTEITGETSDGYHTFNELYEFRKVFNAVLFSQWADLDLYNVHKSKKHYDGEDCFGGGWFIVMATLPTGQISNHYEMKDWDLFRCEERERADEWDGHTAQDVLERLSKYLKQEEKE